MSDIEKNQQNIKTIIGKKLISFANKVVDFGVLVLVLILLFASIYSLWDSHKVYAAADASNYAIYKPSRENSITFDELRKKNEDVFAWLTVDDTSIDYPVTHWIDNTKYINTDAEGNYNMAGALFLDYENNINFEDFNNIIYGHHMDRYEMFGELTEYEKEDFFNSHTTGWIWYDGKGHDIEFFAYISGDAYDTSIYAPAVQGDSERMSYVDNIYNKAKYTRECDIKPSDHIVLLSTCSSYETNGRAILVGKIKDEISTDDNDMKMKVN